MISIRRTLVSMNFFIKISREKNNTFLLKLRSTRTTKSRLQLILPSIIIALFVLYLFVHQGSPRTTYEPAQVQQHNTFQTKKSPSTQPTPLNQSSQSFSEPSNCAYQVELNPKRKTTTFSTSHLDMSETSR